ncbi:30S ribosomal protein S7 [Gemmatimonadota bacterium]
MPRRKRAEKRELKPDPVYGSVQVTRFINNLMRKGKKSLAERIFYESIERIDSVTGGEGLATFEKAVNSAKPSVEVKSRRVGGATYQVPVEISRNRSTALAIRWLIANSKDRPEHTMAQRLAAEFLAATRGEGATMKKKDDTHRMAEANKAFAHYRW